MYWPQIAFKLLYIPVVIFILLTLFGIISIIVEIIIPIIPNLKSEIDQIIPVLIILVTILHTFLTLINRNVSHHEEHLSLVDCTYLSIVLLLLILQLWFNELFK